MNNQIIQRILALKPESLLIASIDASADELSMLFSKVRSIVIFNKNQFYLKKMGMIFKKQGIVTVLDEDQLKNHHFDCVLVNDIILNTRYLMNVDFDRVISQATITVDLHGFTKISNTEWAKIDIMNHKSISIVDSKVSFSGEAFCSFFTVNYNTSKLINILIQSIHKYVKSFKYDIWVFDNSDREKLELFEEWPDVHVIDNTKGQVIDYGKEIPKYCNLQCLENFKGFISVKHALAIQAGIDNPRISDNFILCDSDIIIFKDLNFINDKTIAIGKLEQKTGDVLRIQPFLCYLNKKLLREYNIKYFDHNRFHGCFTTLKQNMPVLNLRGISTTLSYDTGGSLTQDINEKAKKLLKQIDIDDYCIHLGSRSRIDTSLTGRWKHINLNELCKQYEIAVNDENLLNDDVMHISFKYVNEDLKKIYNKFKDRFEIKNTEKKYAIYTAITGNYESLKKIDKYDENFDYICFTDTPIKSSNWKIVDIKDAYTILGIRDPQLLARFIKTHPHLLLKNYELSIWIDGNANILCDDLKNKFIPLLSDEYILMKAHRVLKDVYAEGRECILLKKDSKNILEKMMDFFRIEQFTDSGAHVETGVILRKHNDEECVFMMERWWEMILKYSIRDQMSFNYVFWKYKGKFGLISSDFMYKNFFNFDYKHKK